MPDLSIEPKQKGKLRLLVVMGVSGCGKSTIGSLLSQRLQQHHLDESGNSSKTAFRCEFLDGDDFHSQENIDKMHRGIALTDSDREPWLARLREVVRDRALSRNDDQNTKEGRLDFVVLACSALKRTYRAMLLDDENYDTTFVYLKCNADTLRQRVAERKGHFFKENLLKSQLAVLEEPDTATESTIVVESATQCQPPEIVSNVIGSLNVSPLHSSNGVLA